MSPGSAVPLTIVDGLEASAARNPKTTPPGEAASHKSRAASGALKGTYALDNFRNPDRSLASWLGVPRGREHDPLAASDRPCRGGH